MSGHTKGPWTANRDCRSHLNRGIITDGPMVYGIYTPESRIAVMAEFRESGFGPQDAEQEANAKLIAAAPALLDALTEIVEHAMKYGAAPASATQMFDRAVAAIAAARGEA